MSGRFAVSDFRIDKQNSVSWKSLQVSCCLSREQLRLPDRSRRDGDRHRVCQRVSGAIRRKAAIGSVHAHQPALGEDTVETLRQI